MGLGLPAHRRQLWLFVLAFLPAVLNALSNLQNPGAAGMLLILLTATAVGFVEEVIFRGMMLQALLSRGPWQAAIISSLIFGVAHSLNLLFGANLGATLLQIGYTLALGFMFAALALRTHTILLLIVAHSLTDFFGFLAYNSSVVTTGLSALVIVVTCVEMLLYAGYALYLMRGVSARPTTVDNQPQLHTTQRTQSDVVHQV
jgi:membrane protease YdiL (CAAX protease family)